MKFCKCLKTNLVSRNLLFWVLAKKQQLPPLCSHPFRSNNHFTFQFSVRGGDGKNLEVHSHAPQLWACSCFPTASPSPEGTFWISRAWLSLWPHTSSAPLPSLMNRRWSPSASLPKDCSTYSYKETHSGFHIFSWGFQRRTQTSKYCQGFSSQHAQACRVQNCATQSCNFLFAMAVEARRDVCGQPDFQNGPTVISHNVILSF